MNEPLSRLIAKQLDYVIRTFVALDYFAQRGGIRKRQRGSVVSLLHAVNYVALYKAFKQVLIDWHS